MFNQECQTIYPCRKPYAHIMIINVAVYLHMYQCLQNRNEMFAGSDNEI